MNEELTIESIEQWNEEHPDDCHSPWMGGFDDEYEVVGPEEASKPIQVTISADEYNQAPVESQAITVVESDIEPIAKSPCTGESDLVMLIVLGIIGFEIGIIIGLVICDKMKWW
ncbi:MAG: hypothetical protein K6A05_04890 [Lachnospiraceae bacterium]|nr:hypothetical protein [Lachnospiraceae bacterium]